MTKSRARTLIVAAFLVIAVVLIYYIVRDLIDVYEFGEQRGSQGR